MTLYSKLTQQALKYPGDPAAAWARAIEDLAAMGEETEISRAKGCPKSTFVSLAENGYINGFRTRTKRVMSKNASHAVKAYEILQLSPDFRQSKARWWRDVASAKGISRENHAGILDVLLVLIDQGVYQSNQEP